jgi:diguanylate cyclase (GGDEF)-like protein/PAS domain S-box-containing protein
LRRSLENRWPLGLMLASTLLLAALLVFNPFAVAGTDAVIVTIGLCLVSTGAAIFAHRTCARSSEANRCLEASLAEAKREAALAREEHERLRGAFDVLPEPVILFDAQDRLVRWNQAYAQNSSLAEGHGDGRLRPGLSFAESIRINLARGLFPEAEGREEEWLAERLLRHARDANTYEQRLSGGRWVRIEERRTPDGGNVGVRIDITELKRREASFRLLFDDNPAPMCVFDHSNLQFLAVNQAIIDHYGYSREQFLSMSILDITPTEEREAARASIATLGGDRLHTGKTWRHIKADGSEILIAAYSRGIEYEGHAARLTAVVDVTERMKAEEELQRTRAFLEQIIDNVPLCITVKDASDFRFVMLNRAAEQYWGVPRSEAIGKTVGDLLGEKRGDFVTGRDKQALAAPGPVYLGEHGQLSGEDSRIFSSTRVAVRDPHGKPIYVLGVMEDVTERVKAEEELKRTRAFLEQILDNVPVAITVKNAHDLRFVMLNRAGEQVWGVSRAEAIGKTVRDLFGEERAKSVGERDEAALRAEGPIDLGEHRAIGRGDESRIFSMKRVAVRDPNGKPTYVLGVMEDVTERRQAEDDLRRTRAFLDTVIENVPAMLFVKEPKELRYMLVNRAGEQLLGMPRDEMIGKSDHDLLPKEEADAAAARDREILRSEEQLGAVDEVTIHTPHNGTRLVTTKRFAVVGEDSKPQYLLGVAEDITERRRAEERIEHLAHFDGLTDLPNRSAFTARLAATIEGAGKEDASFALLFLDLDRFKEVNDIFGHAAGDALLTEVAKRLESAAQGAFVARLGGDEFTLIVEGPQPTAAAAVADRVVALLADDILFEDKKLRAGVSVGIAIFPADGDDASTLLGNADAALYRAKAQARGSIRFFEAEMDMQLRERRALQHDLQSALAEGEISLHYQPQVRVGGETTGFEVLIRWNHPTRGFISPADFIPIAEESGHIIALGEWVLREACREAASWPKPLHIAVNLSPMQFRHGDLPELIHAVLLDTGLAASRLELEITEGVLIDDFSRALSILRRLKSLGVRIAMDDFGTGYSSLSYLQSFPFDKIKIDRTFISNVENNPQSAAIVRAVIGLARGLDLPVVAEGVENSDQLDFLSRELCDEVQGYLLGRPKPIRCYDELVGIVSSPKDAPIAAAPNQRNSASG